MKKLLFLLALTFVSCKVTPAVSSKGWMDKMIEAYNQKDWSMVVVYGDSIIANGDTLGACDIAYTEGLASVGRINEALLLIQNSVKQNPNDYYRILCLGNIYCATEQYQLAHQCYDRVIKIRPSYARPYINNAMLYAHEGNGDAAADSYFGAIDLLWYNGLYVECEKYAQEIVRLNTNGDNYLMAAVVLAGVCMKTERMSEYKSLRNMLNETGGKKWIQVLDKFCQTNVPQNN